MKERKVIMIIAGVVTLGIIVNLLLFLPIAWTGSLKFKLINLANHGFVKFAIMNGIASFDTRLATDILFELYDTCKQHDIPVILAEGTALGAVRDGKLISWDDDVDLMVEAKYREKFMHFVMPSLRNFVISKAWNKGNFLTLCKSNVAVDIEFIEEGIPCSCTVSGCVECPVKEILDTQVQVSLHGVIVNSWGPAFLEKVYGKSWTIPMHRSNSNARTKRM